MPKRHCPIRLLSGLESLRRKSLSIAFGLGVMVNVSLPAKASVSLLEVVRTALDHAPAMLLQKEIVRISESDVLDARSAFDPGVSLLIGYRKDASSSLYGTELKTVTSSLSSSTLLPIGLIVRPELSVLGYTPSGTLSSSEASAGVTLTFPLMEGFGNNSFQTALKAFLKTYKAENYALQHAASITIYSAADAYWNYLYAYRTLKLDHQLVQSADESFQATKTLAGAGEIALIQVNQAEAYFQQAEMDEVSAAQSLRQAWNTLFLAMGISNTGRENPEEPVDFFPLPDGHVPVLNELTGLKTRAKEFRADLHSLQLRGAASNDLLSGSRNRMKPKIDLDLWAGYNGQHNGSAVDDYLSSLTRGIPGINVSATLRYTFDAGNHADEAAFLRSRAQYETALINRQVLERTIDGGVGLAAESVKNAAALWHISMQSAKSYRLLNAAEIKKYRTGMSDLFKVQRISTDLANAEKQLLAAEKAYASSLLTLRFEVAALMRVEDGCYGVDASDLVTFPQFGNTSKKQ